MIKHVIAYVSETTSTNDCIRMIAKHCEVDDFLTLYTDFQTAGKGQRGNGWESERGKNLLFSMLYSPKYLKASKQFIFSQITSLAIKEVLEKETSDITIKWPNDIYWKNKKIAGILIENELMDEYTHRSVIGVGLNLNQETFESDAPNPVSLKQITGKEYEPKAMLEKITERFSHYYNGSVLYEEDISPIRDSYKESLFRKEGLHLFEDEKGRFYARILDVEPSGLLILKVEDCYIKKYAFKEVKCIL